MADPLQDLYYTPQQAESQYDPTLEKLYLQQNSLSERMKNVPERSASESVSQALIAALPMLVGAAVGGQAGAGYGGMAGGEAASKKTDYYEKRDERDKLYAESEYKNLQDRIANTEAAKTRAGMEAKQDLAKLGFQLEQENRKDARAQSQENAREARFNNTFGLQMLKQDTDSKKLDAMLENQRLEREQAKENAALRAGKEERSAEKDTPEAKQEWTSWRTAAKEFASVSPSITIEAIPGSVKLTTQAVAEAKKLAADSEVMDKLARETASYIDRVALVNWVPNKDQKAEFGALRNRWMALYNSSPLLRGNPSRFEADFVMSMIPLPGVKINEDVSLSNWLGGTKELLSGVSTDRALLKKEIANRQAELYFTRDMQMANEYGIRVYRGLPPEKRAEKLKNNDAAIRETVATRYPANWSEFSSTQAKSVPTGGVSASFKEGLKARQWKKEPSPDQKAEVARLSALGDEAGITKYLEKEGL